LCHNICTPQCPPPSRAAIQGATDQPEGVAEHALDIEKAIDLEGNASTWDAIPLQRKGAFAKLTEEGAGVKS